ncbi:MAG: MFS transporter [Phycisphaerae bacterium]
MAVSKRAEASTTATTTRKVFLALLLFQATRTAASAMIAVAIPYLVLKQLRCGSAALSYIYMVGLVSAALLGLIVGHLSDRWNRKGSLLLTGVLVPVSALLIYFFPDLLILFVASMIGGFAATGSLAGGAIGGAARLVETAIITDVTSLDNRTWYFAIRGFIGAVGAAVGALLVSFFSLANSFLAAGVISVLGLLVLLPLKIPPRPGQLAHLNESRKESRKAIGKFAVIGVLNGFSQALITPFLIPFFVLMYGIGKSQMASYAASATVVGALALLAAPVLEKVFGFIWTITLTRTLGTLLLVVMALWHNRDIALAIYLVLPALRIAGRPAQQTALTRRVRADSVSRALAINQAARVGSSCSAVLLTGYLFEISAIETPFFLYGLVMGVNLFLYFKFFSADEPK